MQIDLFFSFQNYMLYKITPVYNALGWTYQPDDDVDQQWVAIIANVFVPSNCKEYFLKIGKKLFCVWFWCCNTATAEHSLKWRRWFLLSLTVLTLHPSCVVAETCVYYRMFRRDIIASACDYGMVDCLQQAQAEYDAYIIDPSLNRYVGTGSLFGH